MEYYSALKKKYNHKICSKEKSAITKFVGKLT